jgi:hypothetical protein
VHSSGNYFITQDVDTIPNSSSSNLINSKGVAAAIAGPKIVACGLFHGGNNAFNRQYGFDIITTGPDADRRPYKVSTGRWKFRLATALSHSNYCMFMTIIDQSDANGRDDIIAQAVAGSRTTQEFSVMVHEGDNSDNAGTFIDCQFIIQVVDF